MLVLERHEHERIMIGDDIIVEVVMITHGKVRIGILAKPEVPILREELLEQGPCRHVKTRQNFNS